MRYGQIAGISKPVSRLVQGSATRDADGLPQIFDLAFERGINAFDSAHIYGPKSEGALGRWVRERNVADKVVIVAKGSHHGPEGPRVTPEAIEADMNESMERMGLGYFDAYVLHRDDPAVPVGPIVEALNSHAQAGRIGAFGGSNWTFDRIDAANRYAKEHNLRPFSISSPNISLAVQVKPPWANCVSISGEAGAESRAYYKEHANDIAVLTWSSLAGGFFSGRFTPESEEAMRTGASYFDKNAVETYACADNYERVKRAGVVAIKYRASIAQIALSYVTHQDMNIFALMFCYTADEFDQNVAALDIELTPGEIAYLELKSDSPD